MIAPIYREIPGLLRLSWPLILTQLAQVGIVFTDALMMGILGTGALAGAGLGATIFSFLQMFSLGVITVITNLVTSHAQDEQAVKKIVHSGLFIAAILSIFFGIVLWHIEPALIFLGQDPSIVDTTMLYLRALLWGILPSLLFMTLRSFTIGVMQPKIISIITVCAMGLNVVLNLVFIFAFPELGVMNLGIASSLVFLLMFITLMFSLIFDSKFIKYQLFSDFKSFSLPLVFKIIRLGMPMGMIFAFEMGFFVLGVFLAGLFGATALAAHNIAIQFVFLTYMVSVGIANATSVLISQAYGEKQIDRIHCIARAGITLGLLWMSIPALLFWKFPEPFIHLFTYFTFGEVDSVFILAIQLLLIAAAFQFFDGMQAIIFSILRGLEEGFKPMIIAVIGYWFIGAPLAYLFGFVFEQELLGIWWGLAAGLAVTSLLGWIYFEIKIIKLKAN